MGKANLKKPLLNFRQMVSPDDKDLGWFAVRKSIPLGYLNDPEKSQATFPTIDGVRYSVPGDRVKLSSDGKMVFMGRDSVTINSGGEKIFAEEVEQALIHHPAIQDVVVSSRPSERWGNEVVAIVQTSSYPADISEELNETAAAHIARYKLPKAYIFVKKVKRGENGKTDYRWAKAKAEAPIEEHENV
jgi:3-oxocholest-4-en-26-oate---CoA ligase